MSMLQHGLSEDSSYTSYTINQSLRFRASNSANLSRTYTSNATWTFSIWLKRGAMGVISPILGDTIKFNANDTLTAVGLTTTAVFRDPSAWYHIHVSNGGLYVNGVSFGAVTTSALTNTKIGTNGTNYFDGYIAHPYFIDSTSSSYNNFGITDAVTGIWIPKAFSGSYGTTGGFWPFNDATSLTTLGYDRSGNGNNWTLNNVSITAGATYDVMKDSPTNGPNEVGNYAVLNPLDKGSSVSTLDGNLKWAVGGTSNGIRASEYLPSSGKFYWEATVIANGGNEFARIGVCGADISLNVSSDSAINQWLYAQNNGYKLNAGTAVAYGTAYTNGDIISVAVDVDNGKIWWAKNGVWQASGDPASGVNPAYSNISVTKVSPYFTQGGLGITIAANFGQRPFAYTPPTGFKPLHTGNLPASTPITTSGTFTGNASTDGPCVFINGTPTAMTINGNAVTFATHADKLAGGFKIRSSSASYNASGTNTYSITTNSGKFKYARAQSNP